MNEKMSYFRQLCESYRKMKRYQFCDVRHRRGTISVVWYSIKYERFNGDVKGLILQHKIAHFKRDEIDQHIKNMEEKTNQKQTP